MTSCKKFVQRSAEKNSSEDNRVFAVTNSQKRYAQIV